MGQKEEEEDGESERKDGGGMRVGPGEELRLRAHFRVENKRDMKSRVPAPRFPKPKDFGWWILLGAPEMEEGENLLAMKRIVVSRRAGKRGQRASMSIGLSLKNWAAASSSFLSFSLSPRCCSMFVDVYVGDLYRPPLQVDRRFSLIFHRI